MIGIPQNILVLLVSRYHATGQVALLKQKKNERFWWKNLREMGH
jgi:hypothetical protein